MKWFSARRAKKILDDGASQADGPRPDLEDADFPTEGEGVLENQVSRDAAHAGGQGPGLGQGERSHSWRQQEHGRGQQENAQPGR